jgi:putative ABC transport system permease protein
VLFAAAARSLFRQPSFALAAVGTLALGIAAPTALFSTVNAVLLKPLPYPRPQDIYTVRTFFPSGRFTIGLVASEELSALARITDAVAVTAATRRGDGAIVTDGGARQVVSYAVSERFFELFGAPLALGRGIAREDAVQGAPPVVVLSHALWTAAYGGRPEVVGTSIDFGDRPVRVIGVARADFNVPLSTAVWYNAWMPDSIGHTYEGYVRLQPDVTVASIEGRLDQAMDTLGKKYPDQNSGRAYALRPLLDATVGDLRPILLILFGATALLLVLAAANVTNLVLVRSMGRAREIAIRAALGAGRGRIVRLLVEESLLLAACGGLAGIVAAYAAVRLLMRFGGSRLPRLDSLAFDATVVAFVAVLVVVTGLVVGIVPALRVGDGDVASLMNETGRSVRGSRKTRRLLALFVVAEIVVAVALVAGAARLVRSYQHLERIDPGFDPRGRLVLDVLLPRSYMTQPRRNSWWETAEARLRAAGATQVASASSLPLQQEWDSTTFIDLVSRPDIPPDKRPNARMRLVSPEFFQAMGIRMLSGRAFTEADGPNGESVTIVNEAFVRRSFPEVDPLRERVKDLDNRIVNGKLVVGETAVVGVVADVHYASLTAPAEPTVYVSRAQYLSPRELIVVTTADGTPERHIAEFRAALREVDPKLPVEFGVMSTFVAASLDRHRLGMWLMSGFGIAALLLAMVGVFGVIAYVVAQRTGEMAVRQALGATRAQVVWIVVKEGGKAVALGIAGGLVIAWWMGRMVAGYAFGVAPGDPAILAGSAAVVGLVAIAATVTPAARAATSDLWRALRQD